MEAFNINLTNLKDVVFFLLPGLIWVSLFFYQLPTRQKSDFILIVLSVVVSSILTLLTTMLFGFINFVTNLQTALSVNTDYFGYSRLGLAILASIGIARFFQSDIFQKISSKIFGVHIVPFGRLWNDFFKLEASSVIRVVLVNGNCYVGMVRRSSVDPNDQVQELELWKPLYYDLNSGKSTPIKETETILIQAGSIVSVEKLSKEVAKKIYK